LAFGMTGVVGTVAPTPAAAQRCGQAPNCNNTHGDARRHCLARRAHAEADCQARGRGDARGNPGKGPRYRRCKQTEESFDFDEATTYRKDC
jgi:hypothetical protein